MTVWLQVQVDEDAECAILCLPLNFVDFTQIEPLHRLVVPGPVFGKLRMSPNVIASFSGNEHGIWTRTARTLVFDHLASASSASFRENLLLSPTQTRDRHPRFDRAEGGTCFTEIRAFTAALNVRRSFDVSTFHYCDFAIASPSP